MTGNICTRQFRQWRLPISITFVKTIPIIDGNKRVALASTLVFLDINGYQFHCEDGILYGKIMDVAKGEAKKEELISFFEEYSTRK